MNLELIISICAAGIALYAVLIQKKELKNQVQELNRTAEANEEAQKALNKQVRLQSLSALLEAEIHLHEFNNKKEICSEQKQWAKGNFEQIQKLKKEINEIL